MPEIKKRCFNDTFDDPELGIEGRIDVWFKISKGNVIGFAVNLSYPKGEKSYNVYRYDTSHGYAHREKLWEKGNGEEKIRGKEYSDILNQAIDDIKENWRRYIQYYKRAKGV